MIHTNIASPGLEPRPILPGPMSALRGVKLCLQGTQGTIRQKEWNCAAEALDKHPQHSVPPNRLPPCREKSFIPCRDHSDKSSQILTHRTRHAQQQKEHIDPEATKRRLESFIQSFTGLSLSSDYIHESLCVRVTQISSSSDQVYFSVPRLVYGESSTKPFVVSLSTFNVHEDISMPGKPAPPELVSRMPAGELWKFQKYLHGVVLRRSSFSTSDP
ncbi:hypothetical protein M433DRAFT_331962 [Acidomyces richmondensis BFW]|nr:MAG: hypothetical protein FE78DRAFT_513041 [Acidomyces sp. 'richmondensis']KYG49244.1 hypothetical protein M433DRAFT_331962 [Acidomyces richmondensis BFW]